MAQRGTWTERMGKARAALSGGAGRARTWKVAAAAALACAAFVAAGLWLAAPPSGVVVERATQAPDAATTAAPATSAQAATAAQAADSTAPATPAAARVVTHVDGAVNAPGVYVLTQDDPRVNDAVQAAGGLAPGAVTDGLNLAAPLADGAKVHVPYEGEEMSAAEPAATATADVGGVVPTATPQQPALVNINSASVEELQTLTGIGPAKAQAIVAYRTEQGPFAVPEDLMLVSGIGQGTFAKLQGQICV